MASSTCALALVLALSVGASVARGSEPWWNETQVYTTTANSGGSNGVFVGLTLIQSAAAKGAGNNSSLVPGPAAELCHSLICSICFVPKISFLLADTRPREFLGSVAGSRLESVFFDWVIELCEL